MSWDKVSGGYTHTLHQIHGAIRTNSSLESLGEFGLVYRGDWFADDSGKPTAVAIKTLKG